MFIILNPSASGNPSNEFRIVDDKDWAAYRDAYRKGVKKAYAFTPFPTYDEAKEARDKANAGS